MTERDVIELRLERPRFRSLSEVLRRYGVELDRLYRWRRLDAPPFPPPVHVVGEPEEYFPFFALIRWEIDFARRRRQVLQ